MVSIYHDSVGHGGNMLLNLAPPPNSTLPDVAMETYKVMLACLAAARPVRQQFEPTTF